jgi:hypothetical protein
MRNSYQTPDTPLILPSGQPRFGFFKKPPSDVNWRDYDSRDPLGNARPEWTKNFRFKHFDFYGVQTPDMVFGCALIRLGLVNMAFAYVFDKASKQFSEWSRLSPLDLHLHLDTRPDGQSRFQKGRSEVVSHRDSKLHRLTFNIDEQRNGEVLIDIADKDLLALCTPIANTGFSYAQKASGMSVSGGILWHGKHYEINPLTAGSCHDWTAGFLRRETFWNWLYVTGHLPDGRTLCLNVSCGVNETSFSENGYWLDGQFQSLATAAFSYDKRAPESAGWTVQTSDGTLFAQFQPEGAKKEHLDRCVMSSRFTQCFGGVKGFLQTSAGERIDLSSCYGWCEDHYAKW